MKLRTQVFWAVLTVAVVLIAAATVVTRQIVAASYRRDFDSLTQEATGALRREISMLQHEVARATDALASSESGAVASMLHELEYGGGAVSDNALRALRIDAATALSGMGLDELWVIGADGRVWLAPHQAAWIGESRPELMKVAPPERQAIFAQAPALFLDPQLRVVAHRVARRGLYALHVIAARRVSPTALDVVSRPGLVTTRLVDAARQPWVEADPKASWARVNVEVPLLGDNEQAVAYAQASVSDETLSRVLRRLTYLALAGAAVALVLAGLLATWLARRVTARLATLMAAANSVASGDLSTKVDVRGHDELARLGRVFNEMVVEVRRSRRELAIAERTAAWQDMARHLAHEIKNPLTPIQMSMDTLRRAYERQHPEFAAILQESTGAVLEEADRLRRFATEFGNFARLPRPSFTRFDIVTVCRTVASLRRGTTPISIDAQPDVILLEGDRDQWTQVLHNLLDNAIDAVAQVAARRDGHIEIRLRVNEDRVSIEVQDNGVGIDPDARERVFTPYVTSKSDRGGTGLGLAIVWRIVHEHNGRIDVVDAAPGTCFSMHVPLRQAVAAHESGVIPESGLP